MVKAGEELKRSVGNLGGMIWVKPKLSKLVIFFSFVVIGMANKNENLSQPNVQKRALSAK